MDIWIQIGVSLFYTLASESYPITPSMSKLENLVSKMWNEKTVDLATFPIVIVTISIEDLSTSHKIL
jgi:hypothetical protein